VIVETGVWSTDGRGRPPTGDGGQAPGAFLTPDAVVSKPDKKPMDKLTGFFYRQLAHPGIPPGRDRADQGRAYLRATICRPR
jgi:hypothetical protein